MGTHPIFESDFDCLTEMANDTLSGDLSLTDPDTLTHELNQQQQKNDLELLRIELESKKLQIEALKHDFQAKFDDVEERAQIAERNARVLQAKLSHLSVEHDQRKSRSQNDLQQIIQRQTQLEATNRKLCAEAQMMEEGLLDLTVTESQYQALSIVPAKERTIQQLAQIKIFEVSQPIRTQCSLLQSQLNELTEDFAAQSKTLQSESEKCAKIIQEKGILDSRVQKLESELKDARELVTLNHEKGQKFDKTSQELNLTKRNLEVLEARLAETEKNLSRTTAENRDLIVKYETTRQRRELLEEDKKYLRNSNKELTEQKLDLENRVSQLLDQNMNLQQAREDILEKYITGTDRVRSEVNKERQNQIQSLKIETDSELVRIKQNLQELYSRENNALRESRDCVTNERDNLRIENDRLKDQLRNAQQDVIALRSSQAAQFSEFETRVQTAEMESRRAALAKQDLQNALETAQCDAKSAKSKADLLQREVYQTENKAQKTQLELESELLETTKKLKSYESLEKELDSVVLQCADDENETDPQKILLGYGCGTNLPTNSRRRMQQSVRLAKRVLNLERINVDLQRENDSLKVKTGALKEQLESAESALDGVNQPYQYLLTAQKDKDNTIFKLKQKLKAHQTTIIDQNDNIQNLKKVKEQLIFDVEKLLSNRDEIRGIRENFETFGERASRQKLAELDQNDPKPLIFTKPC